MIFRNRRSGLSLVLVGILGILFFWMTDHGYGLAANWGGPSSIDQANQSLPGTVIGMVGSTFVALIGVWLMSRKTV